MTDSPENNSDLDTPLASLRAEIDALDDRLIALIKERCEIVAKVGEYKKAHQSHTHHIRPGREAAMIRRIWGAFEGSKFLPYAAAGIWRWIITASTMIETPLSVSVYAPEQDLRYYWLAREYFGPFMPIRREPTFNRVLGDVMESKASAGILPMPDGEPGEQWWQMVAGKSRNWPKIFATLPFAVTARSERHLPQALAIGNIRPEATGDDVTLLVLDTDTQTSTNRLQTGFSKAGLGAQWIAVDNTPAQSRRHLIALKSFVDEDHDALKQFLADMGASVTDHHLLGTYAAPVALQEKTAEKSFEHKAVHEEPVRTES